jgi:glycosyltransferase involved in cell wall biosynthesis
VNVDIAVCTNNPRPDVIRRVIASLGRQTLGPTAFQVLVVDNASSPPVDPEILAPLQALGFRARCVVEPVPGLARARLRALSETRGDWLLFVDDDNELDDDYVEQGMRFAQAHPGVGAFGGKLRLPPGVEPPAWADPFLTYLGIRDAGDEVIIGASDRWGPWEPPGAGLFVRRDVVCAYAEFLRVDPRGLRLGRTGQALASCDDSLLVRQAPRMGLSSAYVPGLSLVHHIAPRRFRYGYLLRLLGAFGASLTLLEALIRGAAEVPVPYRWPRLVVTLWHAYRVGRRSSYRFAAAMVLHHYTAWRTWRELARSSATDAPARIVKGEA